MSSLGGGQQQHGPPGHGEARARLRWTRQLHDRFVLAVAQLGGADSESSISSSPLHSPTYSSHTQSLDATDVVGFLCHCRGDTQVRAEGDGRAGAHAVPPQEPPPGPSVRPAGHRRIIFISLLIGDRALNYICLLRSDRSITGSLLLQKYRLAVSRGVASPLGDNGDGADERSSSSESQPDEYDDGTVAELHGDSSRSMSMAARVQREVQRKLQEQIEVNDGSVDHHSELVVSADCQFMVGC